MERMTSPPFGLRGGSAGAAAVVTLTTPDGVTRHLPSKGAFAAPAGSVIDMIDAWLGWFWPARPSATEQQSAATCSMGM